MKNCETKIILKKVIHCENMQCAHRILQPVAAPVKLSIIFKQITANKCNKDVALATERATKNDFKDDMHKHRL